MGSPMPHCVSGLTSRGEMPRYGSVPSGFLQRKFLRAAPMVKMNDTWRVCIVLLVLLVGVGGVVVVLNNLS